jgi:putative endonuclease
VNLRKGLLAEDRAVEYLQKLDFQIIERNFYSRYGEIDIVAIKENLLHFIEVKSGEFINPAINMTEKKLERVIKTVDIYLAKKRDFSDVNLSIDLILITPKNIELIENITI